jgi:hypothetical protein
MKLGNVLFFGFLGIGLLGFSQEKNNEWKSFPVNDSNVIIPEPTSIDTAPMIEIAPQVITPPGSFTNNLNQEIINADAAYTDQTKANPLIKGYTILIFSTSGANSKLNARKKLVSFTDKYPNDVVHLAWKSPNYEVRVGDFRTKLEAEKVLITIKADFPSAFVKPDLIELPPLKSEAIIK